VEQKGKIRKTIAAEFLRPSRIVPQHRIRIVITLSYTDCGTKEKPVFIWTLEFVIRSQTMDERMNVVKTKFPLIKQCQPLV
jgi:hypothetical protein